VNKRTKFLLGIGVIATLVIGWQVAAFAVHDLNVFELEGNALDDPVAGDDWENVAPGGTQNVPGAGAKSFEEEEPADASTIFTGGGSKDPQDISSWKWKNGGGLPDKDNLLHSFAARYTDEVTGDELLYFGSDRFDNSGDAVQGFWFLQDEVTPVGTNGGGFDGLHTNGDLLILSDFSNGGDVSTINVYEWDDRCNREGDVVDRDGDPLTDDDFVCGDANLLLLASSEAANCDTVADGDDFCGIVNSNTIELPWTFTDKSGTTFDHDGDPDTPPIPGALNGEFFEGGVNLTALGLGERCFSTVISESRSSTSTTAVLKDFVIADFDVCEAALTTQTSPSGTVTPGTSVTDTATVTVTGAENPDDPTGTVKFFLCGPDEDLPNPIDPDDPNDPDDPFGCTTGGTQIGTPLEGETLVDSDPPTPTNGTATATSEAVNTADSPLGPGKYCFRAEYSGDDDNDPATHTNLTTECFTVSQPTTISTTQSVLPQDSATVTPAGTAGTVVFSLYNNGTCSGTPVATFEDSSAPFTTNNQTTQVVSATGAISWSATFDPTGAEDPSTTTRCERTDLTINNSASDFPPPASP
jgi:hypothetical protein